MLAFEKLLQSTFQLFYIFLEFKRMQQLRRVRSFSHLEQRVGSSLEKLRHNMINEQKKYRTFKSYSESNFKTSIGINDEQVEKKMKLIRLESIDRLKHREKKYQQSHKLRSSLKMKQPRCLKINLNDQIKKHVPENGYAYFEIQQVENLRVDPLAGKIIQNLCHMRPILQGNGVILEGNDVQYFFTISHFQRILDICRRIQNLPIFKDFSACKILKTWSSYTKKQRMHRILKKMAPKVKKMNLPKLLFVRKITLQTVRYNFFSVLFAPLSLAQFEQYLNNCVLNTITSIQQNKLTQSISEFSLSILYEEMNTQQQKIIRSTLLADHYHHQQQSESKSSQFTQHSAKQDIYKLNLNYTKIVAKFSTFLRRTVYLIIDVFVEILQQAVKQVVLCVKKALDRYYQTKDETVGHLSNVFAQTFENIKSANNFAYELQKGQGISLQIQFSRPMRNIALPNNISSVTNLYGNYFKQLQDLFDQQSTIFWTKPPSNELFIDVTKKIDEYRITMLPLLSHQDWLLIKEKIGLNIREVDGVFAIIKMIFDSILQTSCEYELLLKQSQIQIKYSLEQSSKNLQDDQQYIKNAKKLQKKKDKCMEYYRRLKNKFKVLEYLPDEIKIGIYVLSARKIKLSAQDCLINLKKQVQTFFPMFFNTVSNVVIEHLRQFDCKIILLNCCIEQFVKSTKAQLVYESMLPGYIVHAETLRSIIYFLRNQDLSIKLEQESGSKILKLQQLMKILNFKIQNFDLTKRKRLKQLIKSKERIKEQIWKALSIHQNQIYECVNSCSESFIHILDRFPVFQSKMQQIKANIDNFTFIENMQIEHCLENKLTHFSSFDKLQSDTNFIKQIVEKYLQIHQKIKEVQETSIFECNFQEIIELVGQALSECNISQILLAPFAFFINKVKLAYHQYHVKFKVIDEITELQLEELEQIGNGKYFDFTIKQTYTVKEVIDFKLHENYQEIQKVFLRKNYFEALKDLINQFEIYTFSHRFQVQYQTINEHSVIMGPKSGRNAQNIDSQIKVCCTDSHYDENELIRDKQSRKQSQIQVFKRFTDIQLFLEDYELELSYISDASFSMIEPGNNSDKNQQNFHIKKTVQKISKSIHKLLSFVTKIWKIQEKFLYLCTSLTNLSHNSTVIVQFCKNVRQLKFKWQKNLIEYLENKQIHIVLKQQVNVEERLRNFEKTMGKVEDIIEQKIEEGLRESKQLYLFPKNTILKILCNPLEFFQYFYESVKEAYIDQNHKQIVLETYYKQKICIPMRSYSVDISVIRQDLRAVIHHQAIKLPVHVDGSDKYLNTIQQQLTQSIVTETENKQKQANLIQIDYLKMIFELQYKVNSQNKSQSEEIINQKINEIVNRKVFFDDNYIHKREIFVSACIEMRERFAIASDEFWSSESLHYEIHRENCHENSDVNEKKINHCENIEKKSKSNRTNSNRRNKMGNSHISINNIQNNYAADRNKLSPNQQRIDYLSSRRKSQQSRSKEHSMTKLTSNKSIRINLQNKNLNQKKNTGKLIISNQTKFTGNKMLCKDPQNLTKSSDISEFKIFYCNFNKRIQLSYELIDLRSLIHYPKTQKMLLSYFHAFSNYNTVNLVEDSESLCSFSARLFRTCHIIEQKRAKSYRKTNHLINIAELTNVTVLITGFENILNQLEKKIVLYLNNVHDNEKSTSFSKKQFPNLFILSHQVIEPALQSHNLHLIANQQNNKPKIDYRVIHYEIPPIEILLSTYALSLKNRLDYHIIDEIIKYMKSYSFCLQEYKQNKMGISDLKEIFMWLIEQIEIINEDRVTELHQILKAPYANIGINQIDIEHFIVSHLEEIKRALHLKQTNETSTNDEILQIIAQKSKKKRFLMFLGPPGSGKTTLIKSIIEKKPYLYLNPTLIQLSISQNDQQEFWERVRKEYFLYQHHIQQAAELIVIVENLVGNNHHELLQVFEQDELSLGMSQKLQLKYYFQAQSIKNFTPQILPYIQMIQVPKSYQFKYASDKILRAIRHDLELDQNEEKELIVEIQSIEKIIKRVLKSDIKKYLWYNLSFKTVCDNFTRFLISVLEEDSQKLSILFTNGRNKKLLMQSFRLLIWYSLFWTLFYFSNEDGRKILPSLLNQIVNLPHKMNAVFEECELILTKEGPLFLSEKQNPEKLTDNSSGPSVANIFETENLFRFVLLPQIKILLKHCQRLIKSYGKICLHGQKASGKTKFLSIVSQTMQNAKTISVLLKNETTPQKKLNKINDFIMHVRKNQRNSTSAGLISLKYLSDSMKSIEKTGLNGFIVLVEDYSLESPATDSHQHFPQIFYTFLKHISQNKYYYCDGALQTIQTFPLLVEKRNQNQEFITDHWQLFHLYFSPSESYMSRIFQVLIDRVESAFVSPTLMNLTDHNNQNEGVIINKNLSTMKQAENIFKMFVKSSKRSSQNWLFDPNIKVFDKSLRMFINMHKSLQGGKITASYSRDETEPAESLQKWAGQEHKTSKSKKTSKSCLHDFIKIFQFNLCSMLQSPSFHSEQINCCWESVMTFLKSQRSQFHDIRKRVTQKKRSLKKLTLDSQFLHDFMKFEFAMKNSKIVLINSSRIMNGMNFVTVCFQLLNKKYTKIESNSNDIFVQMGRSKKISDRQEHYVYFPLQIIQRNEGMLDFIEKYIYQKDRKPSLSKPVSLRSKRKTQDSVASLRTERQLDIYNNSMFQPDYTFIIEYPDERSPILMREFMSNLIIIENATVIWVNDLFRNHELKHRNQYSQNSQTLQQTDKNTFHRFPVCQSQMGYLIYRNLLETYSKKQQENISCNFRILQRLYFIYKQQLKQHVPKDISSYLFNYFTFNIFVSTFFKIYFDVDDYLIGNIQSIQSVISSLEFFFGQYDKMKNQSNENCGKQRQEKMIIIHLQKDIENLTNMLNEYEKLDVKNQIMNLQTQTKNDEKIKLQFYAKMEKYKKNSEKYCEQINRTEIAQLKYLFNSSFKSHKPLFETIGIIISDGNLITDKETLKKIMMDANLIVKIKQKKLLQIRNSQTIKIILEKIHEFHGFQKDNSMYVNHLFNYLGNAIKYCQLEIEREEFIQKIDQNILHNTQAIKQLQSKFNLEKTHQQLGKMRTLMAAKELSHSKLETQKSDLLNKLANVTDKVEVMKLFKNVCREKKIKLSQISHNIQSYALIAASQSTFVVSLPEIYRLKFRSLARKRIQKITGPAPSNEQLISFYINYIISNSPIHEIINLSKYSLTTSKLFSLTAICDKIKQKSIIIYDPDYNFIRDLTTSQYIELKLHELAESTTKARIADYKLIVINLDEEWSVQFCSDSIFTENGFIDSQKKIRYGRNELKLKPDQYCVFIKHKLDSLNELSNQYFIVCYDFESPSQINQLTQQLFKRIYCRKYSQKHFKKWGENMKQPYELSKRLERELIREFVQLFEEICQDVMCFELSQISHLNQICNKAKQILLKEEQIKQITCLLSFDQNQKRGINAKKVGRYISTAFRTLNDTITEQPKYRISTSIQQKLNLEILESALKLACEYALLSTKSDGEIDSYVIRFVLSYLSIGQHQTHEYLPELYLNTSVPLQNQEKSYQQFSEYTHVIEKIMAGLQHFQSRQNYQKSLIKFEINNYCRVSFNLNFPKITMSQLKKKMSKKASFDTNEQNSLSMIQNIKLKCFLKESLEPSSTSELALFNKFQQEKQDKFVISVDPIKTRDIILSIIFDLKKQLQNSEVSSKQMQCKRSKTLIICYCNHISWIKIVIREFKEAQKLIIKNQHYYYEVVKESEIHQCLVFLKFTQAIQEIEEKPKQMQCLTNIIFVIICDGSNSTNSHLLQQIVNNFHTIMIIDSNSHQHTMPRQLNNYYVNLPQLFNLFLSSSITDIASSGLQLNQQNIKQLQQIKKGIQRITISQDTLSAYLANKSCKLQLTDYLRQFSNNNNGINSKQPEYLSSFKTQFQTIINGTVLFNYIQSSACLENIFKSFQTNTCPHKQFLRLFEKSVKCQGKGRGKSVENRQQKEIVHGLALFKSHAKMLNHSLKQFQNKLRSYQQMNKKIDGNNPLKARAYLKKVILETNLKYLIEQLSSILTLISSINRSNLPTLQNYEKYKQCVDYLKFANLQKLHKTLEVTVRQINCSSAIFLNSVTSPLTHQLFNRIHFVPIKIQLFNNKDQSIPLLKMDLITLFEDGNHTFILKDSNAHNDHGGVEKNRETSKSGNSKNNMLNAKLTPFNEYYRLELNQSAKKMISMISHY